MKKMLLMLLITPLLWSSATTAKEGTFDAKTFVESKCFGCHDTSVYTRSNRRITSLKALEVQVRRCDNNLGTTLFDDDFDAVVNYLNTNYYKF